MGALGALGLLAPVGETLQAQFQAGGEHQQQATNRTAFGKALEQLGPEYEFARQMYGAGASPDAVLGVLQGDIGKDIKQRYQQHQIEGIMAGEGSDLDKQTQLLAQGFMKPETFYKLRQLEAKSGLVMTPEQKQQDIASWAANPPAGVDPSVLARARMLGNQPNPNPAELDEFIKNVIPSSEKVRPGAEGIEWKPLWNPKTKQIELTAVPKAVAPGTVAGLVAPRAGGTQQQQAAQMLESTKVGLEGLDKMLDDYKMSKSRAPMWGAVWKQKLGIAGDAKTQDVLGQISTLHANLIGMVSRAWGSRNAAFASEITEFHIPKVGDSPVLVKQKIHDWLRPGGYLDLYRIAVGETPTSETPGAADPGDWGG